MTERQALCTKKRLEDSASGKEGDKQPGLVAATLLRTLHNITQISGSQVAVMVHRPAFSTKMEASTKTKASRNDPSLSRVLFPTRILTRIAVLPTRTLTRTVVFPTSSVLSD